MKATLNTRCPACGAIHTVTVDPAAIMGSQKKTMSEAAIQQRKDAAASRVAKLKEKKNDQQHG